MIFLKDSKSFRKRNNFFQKKKNRLSALIGRPIFILLWGMENFEEKTCLCALNRIFGFMPKAGIALISHLGSASELFSLNAGELDEILGPYSAVRNKITLKAKEEAAEELLKLEKSGIGFIGWNEEDYPALLHECEDAPIGLYVRSSTPPGQLWLPSRKIAVVGTRDISPYGKEWCKRTVAGLGDSAEKPVIISGLALGTDICAHKTALECGLPTIGVMATGPETVYPYRHSAFAEQLCRTPGCALVTDYPPGTAPLAIHFLRRNRIIAGLSDSTILIESKIKGGGMMTCRLAFSYDRDVYALPGRIDDLRSQGCNHLIKNKVAEPITSMSELINSLNLKNIPGRRKANEEETVKAAYAARLPKEMTAQATGIITLIKKERGISIEDIAIRTGSDYVGTSNIIAMLEMDGYVATDVLQRCFLMAEKFR